MDGILTSKPTRIGHLLIPSQGFLKKSWTKRFYALYEASDHGIQRIEAFDSEENFHRQAVHKIIPLADCVKVTVATQKHQCNVFEVVTKAQNYLFSAESFQEMTDWLAAIRCAAFERSVTNVSKLSSPVLPSEQLVVSNLQDEENMIYSSVDTPELYMVRVMDGEIKTRWKLYGTYNLLISGVGISLSDTQKGSIILSWSFRHIRRYGYSHENFSFEAGRKSTSGEGTFVLETKDGAAIFQTIASHVSNLKSMRFESDQAQSPSPSSDENKGFFSAGTSPKQLSSLDSHLGYVLVKQRPPVPKPPRKCKSTLEESYPLYEDPNTMNRKKDTVYDLPTERREAWKTLGREVEDCYSPDPEFTDSGYKDETEYPDPGYEDVEEIDKSVSGGTSSRKASLDNMHTYGKLNRKPVILKSARAQYAKTPSKPETPPYENIMVDKLSTATEHFVFNESEYAKVLRRKP